MGIKNFTNFIKKYAHSSITYKNINKYKNKTIGIDTNFLIYQIIYAIRARGYDLKQNNINITHIHALLVKLKAFKKYKIKAIFVFDSDAPDIKIPTLEKRIKTKKMLINKYKKDKSKKGKRIHYYVSSIITQEEIDDCRKLIKIFGYQIIDAKEEADAQLAYLYKKKLIDYIVSNDSDILLFGGGKLLTKFTVSKNKKIVEINKKQLLKESKLKNKQLIYLGILLGSDYCQNKTMSPINAYNYVIKNKTIDKLKCQNAINYFMNPPVTKIIKLTNKKKYSNKLLKIFLQDYGLSSDYVSKLLENIDNI